MKKVAYWVFIFIMAIFLINPLSSEARGGHRGGYYGGGHRGGYYGGGYRGGYYGGVYRGWWAPWAVIGGAAVLSPYYAPYYYAPPTVVIREQPQVYFQSATSLTPSPTERIFVYPRLGQSEELQAKDRYECHSWAVSQTNHDPTQPSAENMTEAQRNQMRADYQRAQGACLDGRGYTVK